VANLMGKLGARNRVEIALWAYETKRAIRGSARSTTSPSGDRPGQVQPLRRGGEPRAR